MQRSQRPDRVVTEKIAGEKTKIRIYRSDPEFSGRIEIERNECWQFGIDSERTAELLSSTVENPDLVAEPEVPDWIEISLSDLGIQEVASA